MAAQNTVDARIKFIFVSFVQVFINFSDFCKSYFCIVQTSNSSADFPKDMVQILINGIKLLNN